ncbi:MAG: response regulator transcription factor [Inconstantimicrobium porci]|uniref:response regulator transcription factor n=1 Tax=Inconstantimicrobium porci TaxID=2652291 RepID=UPI002A9112C2|nr:response regulator transcription factor [Inconstantimicrobium porci]MDY5910412.1 response regulator transcription factor [Inconstantimicrobium porci]
MEKQKVLIVEDDVDINNLIMKILKKEDYEVVQAFSGSEAELRISMEQYDIALLDMMLPGVTGEELINKIRNKSDMPIIVVSAKTALEDRVNALNMGADDYITKPFEAADILARVNSQLRRYRKFTGAASSDELKFKKLTLNESLREAKVNGQELNLTAHEFDILCVLVKNPDKVYSRENLYETIWQSGYFGEDNTVNVHVSNVRKKIKDIDPDEEYIKTVWGIGFKLCK